MNTAFVLTGLLNAVGICGVRASLRNFTGTERTVIGTILLLRPFGTAIAGFFTLETFMVHFSGFLLATGAPVAGRLVLG